MKLKKGANNLAADHKVLVGFVNIHIPINVYTDTGLKMLTKKIT